MAFLRTLGRFLLVTNFVLTGVAMITNTRTFQDDVVNAFTDSHKIFKDTTGKMFPVSDKQIKQYGEEIVMALGGM